MNILKLLGNYRQRKRIESAILEISVIILNFEKQNRVIVKDKLRLFKQVNLAESRTTLQEEIAWQKEQFEYLANLSYIVKETKGEREALKIADSVVGSLEKMIVGGRKLIDNLTFVFKSQLACLGSLTDAEYKKEELKRLFDQEFALYKEYETAKKEIPAATEAILQAYYELMSGALQQKGIRQKLLRLEVLAPLAMAIVLSCMYFVIDDPAIREEIKDPKFIALVGGTTYGFSKYMKEVMKIVNYLEIMKKKKKPSQ